MKKTKTVLTAACAATALSFASLAPAGAAEPQAAVAQGSSLPALTQVAGNGDAGEGTGEQEFTTPWLNIVEASSEGTALGNIISGLFSVINLGSIFYELTK